MRRLTLIAVLASSLTACLGGGGGGGSDSGGGARPAVIPKLSELPGDPEKRDAILNQANATEGPEGNNSKLTRKEKKVVTNAAFAAAIIGSMFSKTENVTFGTATSFDENDVSPSAQPKQMGPKAPSEQAPPAAQLVPWVQLPADKDAPAPAPVQPLPDPAQPR